MISVGVTYHAVTPLTGRVCDVCGVWVARFILGRVCVLAKVFLFPLCVRPYVRPLSLGLAVLSGVWSSLSVTLTVSKHPTQISSTNHIPYAYVLKVETSRTRTQTYLRGVTRRKELYGAGTARSPHIGGAASSQLRGSPLLLSALLSSLDSLDC